MGRVCQLLAKFSLILFFVAPCYGQAVNNVFPFATGSGGSTLSVMVTGNDNSGKRNGNPFRTPAGAVNAAQAGDTVLVFPGTYTNNNLLKPNVNWFFYPGSTIYWQVATNYFNPSNNGWGIFDDRTLVNTTNGTTNVIGGYGTFIYDGWQGNYGASLTTNGCQTTNQLLFYTATGAASNMFGAFVITNPTTKITVTGHEIRTSYFNGIQTTYDGVTPNPAILGHGAWAIYVANCTNSSFTFDAVGNSPNIYTNNALIMDTDGLGDYLLTAYAMANVNGCYWAHGETYFQIQKIEMMFSGYGLWTDSGNNGQVVTNNGPVEHCWCTFQDVFSHFYDDSLNTNSRVWVQAKTIEPLNANATGAVVCYGSGKVYVTTDKLGVVTNIAVINTVGFLPALIPGSMWITAQKISAGGAGWANIGSENAVIDILQWEDGNIPLTGTVSNTTGITVAGVTNNSIFIRGVTAKMNAANAVFAALKDTTNLVVFTGFNIDMPASTNCAFYLGTNVVAGTNIIIHDVVINAPKTSNSIATTNGAFFVRGYGVYADKAADSHTTVLTGGTHYP